MFDSYKKKINGVANFQVIKLNGRAARALIYVNVLNTIWVRCLLDCILDPLARESENFDTKN